MVMGSRYWERLLVLTMYKAKQIAVPNGYNATKPKFIKLGFITNITPTNPTEQAISRRIPTDSFSKNFPTRSRINGSIKTIATASAIGIVLIAKKKQ